MVYKCVKCKKEITDHITKHICIDCWDELYNQFSSPDVVGDEEIKKLINHIDKCMIGWYNGVIVWHKSYTQQDVIEWIDTLKKLSDKVKEHFK